MTDLDALLGPLPEPEPTMKRWPTGAPWYTADQLRAERQRAYAAGVAAERERCAGMAGTVAQKWWSKHCATNRHMETTREAHDDFCRLQAAMKGADASSPQEGA